MAEKSLQIKLESIVAELLVNNRKVVESFRSIQRSAEAAGRAIDRASAGGGGSGSRMGGDGATLAGGSGVSGMGVHGQAVAVAQRAATAQVQAAQKKATDIEAIEDRFVAKDYQRRVRSEQQAEQAAQREASRAQAAAEKKAQQVTEIEDRLVAKDYQRRTRQEAQAQSAAQRESVMAERKAAKIAEIEDRYASKDYQRQVRAEQQAVRAAERETRQAQVAADRESQRRDRAAQRAEQQVARAAQRETATVEKKARQVAEIEDRWAAREYRDRVNWEQKKEDAAKQSAERANSFWSGAFNVAKGLAGFAGLNTIVNEIRGAFDAANRSAIDAAKFVTDYRKSLLELAALKGQLGESGRQVRGQFAFRAQTLQSAEQATAFTGEYENMVQAAKLSGNITEAESQALAVKAGSFQAAEGGAAGTHGKLAGSLPRLMGGQQTAASVFAKEQQLYKIFQPGGAPFTPMVEQFLGNTEAVQSGLMPMEELASLTSMFSLTEPGQAGAQTGQFIRATLGGIGKLRGTQMMPSGDGEEVLKQGQYLEKLGVTAKMTPEGIGRAISGDLGKQKAAKGADFNAYTYLREMGYGNMEDIKAILEFSGSVQSGTYDSTFKAPALAAPSAADAERQIRGFQATDPVALGRKSEIAQDASRLGVGGEAMEYLQNLRGMAFRSMRDKGQIPYGSLDELQNASGFKAAADQASLRTEMGRMLDDSRSKVGLNPLMKYNTTTQYGFGGVQSTTTLPDDSAYFGMTDYESAQKFYGSAQEVQKRGGDIMPGFRELTAALKKNADSMDLMRQKWEQANPVPPAPVRAPAAPVAGQPLR